MYNYYHYHLSLGLQMGEGRRGQGKGRSKGDGRQRLLTLCAYYVLGRVQILKTQPWNKILLSKFKTNFLKKIICQQDLNPGLIPNHVIILHHAPRGRTPLASFLRMTEQKNNSSTKICGKIELFFLKQLRRVQPNEKPWLWLLILCVILAGPWCPDT